MDRSSSTGWRALSPATGAAAPHFETAEKAELFRLARMAAEALALPASCRFLLEQLCGFYGGETIGGRILVWPSNELLEERSGLTDRTIRNAARRLIELGLLGAKDSANGKRFARRNQAGQIVDAFGYDLSPLLLMAEELSQRIQALRDRQRARKAAYDAMTVNRRAALEAIYALEEWFPNLDTSDLEARYDELLRLTPRRDRAKDLDGIDRAWAALRLEAETRFRSANGGNSDRHKEQNNNAPDQSWNKIAEKGDGAKSEVEVIDVREALPDAWRMMRDVRRLDDLVGEAARLRGAIGAHQSAWAEACEAVGPVRAAVLLLIVVQSDVDAQRTGEVIKSPGGYFRFYARKLAAGELHLETELERMRARRRH